MKNKPKQFNWHFWVFGDKFQVIIETSNYSSARCKMKKLFPNKHWKFQFGDEIIKCL